MGWWKARKWHLRLVPMPPPVPHSTGWHIAVLNQLKDRYLFVLLPATRGLTGNLGIRLKPLMAPVAAGVDEELHFLSPTHMCLGHFLFVLYTFAIDSIGDQLTGIAHQLPVWVHVCLSAAVCHILCQVLKASPWFPLECHVHFGDH